MSGKKPAFFQDYRAMDTRVLLLRYRSGGLVPEAQTALLDVLAERGYTSNSLEEGLHAITKLPTAEPSESRSVPSDGERALSIAEINRTPPGSGSSTTGWDMTREGWGRIVRLSLLAGCAMLAQLALLAGLVGFGIANVFCDSGPVSKCFRFSLVLLGEGGLGVMVWLPAIAALLWRKKWIAWYLNFLPALFGAVLVGAIHWHRLFPKLLTNVAALSALMVMVVLASVHLILSRDRSAQ